jgi:cyclophilin family peptidyl-prolyl cis-trans isomerase
VGGGSPFVIFNGTKAHPHDGVFPYGGEDKISMGEQNGSYPLKEINVEMHSVGSQDEETDDNSESGIVSEITTISRPVEPNRQGSYLFCQRSLIKIFLTACLIIVACLLAVVIVRDRVAPSGSARGADEGNVVSVDSRPSEGKIVEFMVANLNTNAKNCTQISHDLQCVPCHNSATNKFRILLHPEWAPIGVDRFEYLTASGFWSDVRVFRIVPNFVSQFGISSYPDVQRGWSDIGPISDDPVVASNVRGTVTFATSGQNTRTTQIFINMDDNVYLDGEKTKTSHCIIVFSPEYNIFSPYRNDRCMAPIFLF